MRSALLAFVTACSGGGPDGRTDREGTTTVGGEETGEMPAVGDDTSAPDTAVDDDPSDDSAAPDTAPPDTAAGDTGTPDSGEPDCEARSWFPDLDGDGYGDDAVAVEACEAPSGYVATGGDCDDTDPAVHPGTSDPCDGNDTDCDGTVDEDADGTWYADADCDGWGDAPLAACERPAGAVVAPGDCDDADHQLNPDVLGTCDTFLPSAIWSDGVMVRPLPGEDLSAIAETAGSTVSRTVGAIGYGVVAVPEASTVEEFLARVRLDGRVEDVSAMAAVVGASVGEAVAWHLDAIGLPGANSEDLGEVTVAVLDSGVAWEDHEGARLAPALAGVRFVDPWDFVDDDAHPGDESGHGTHLATLIAGLGEPAGVAAGVALMPVRVLDRQDRGTEFALVEGIHHAVDGGAHVVNLGLSMSLNYEPSRALDEALARARDAGVLVVGAAGNSASDLAAFPAAHPAVLGVGALRLDGSAGLAPVAYSNGGLSLDLAAPGGDMGADVDADGFPDGVLAESIYPWDPERTALWLRAGTSQAAALVSGAAARLLAAGASPERARRALMTTATPLSAEPMLDGHGAGALRVDQALAALDDEPVSAWMVTLRPRIQSRGHDLRLLVRVHLEGPAGVADEGTVVVGEIRGPVREAWRCSVDVRGNCEFASELRDGADLESAAWLVSTDAVQSDGGWWRPHPAVLASDALAILTAALGELANLPLFVHEAGDAARCDLDGWCPSDATVTLDLAAGRHAVPRAAVWTGDLLAGSVSWTDVQVDLDAPGLSSTALGTLGLRHGRVDATALATDEHGRGVFELLRVEGDLLAAKPLVFGLDALTDPDAPLLDADGIAIPGALLDLVDTSSGATCAGTPLAAWFDRGGFSGADRRSGVSVLLGAEVLDNRHALDAPATEGRGSLDAACDPE